MFVKKWITIQKIISNEQIIVKEEEIFSKNLQKNLDSGREQRKAEEDACRRNLTGDCIAAGGEVWQKKGMFSLTVLVKKRQTDHPNENAYDICISKGH